MLIERKKYIKKILKYLKIVNSVFLIWWRQVWKTSILKSLLHFWYISQESSFYINFDEIALSGKAVFPTLKDFIIFLEKTYKIDFSKIQWFLFDEVKNIKNFNVLLKALIDRFSNKKFICTSSGNYIWTNEIMEGLAGRTLRIEVYPLDFYEFLIFKWLDTKDILIDSEVVYKAIFRYFLEYITFGWYPKVVLSNLADKYLVLKSILESVFMKDLKEFLRHEQIIDVVKLIKYIVKNIGSKFSYENLSNSLWVKLYFLKKYLKVLEENFIIKTLIPFYTNKKKEISTKSKIYLLDFWVKNFYINNFEKESCDWNDVEMFVYTQLLFNLQELDELYFYQTLNWSEIDFILKRDWRLIPIEAKLWNKIKIPKIFVSFLERYKNEIDFFVKTTQWLVWSKDLNWKEVRFLPFINIKDVLQNRNWN